MRIVVLIKQVPDMRAARFDAARGVIDRSSAAAEINPFDLNALEAAVRIKEELGAEVTAVSMGPDSAETSLRESIARGADAGILLCDRRFGGSDVAATARTLCAGIKKFGRYDLIIAGMQTVDGDTGQVGPELAEMLGIPHISYAEAITEINGDSITIISDIFGGTYKKTAKLPALITVTRDLNAPRLPSIRARLEAKRAEITKWNLGDLGGFLDESQTGTAGSLTKVIKIETPPARGRAGKIFKFLGAEAVDEVIGALKAKKIPEAAGER